MLLLAFALPAFGDDTEAIKSVFLVARKDMPDPFFHDSVVLVTNYGGPAPVGVIVNRRTEITLTSVFADIARLRSRDERIFFGGPVKRQDLVFLFRAAVPPPETIEVLDGVYMSADPEVLRELLGRDNPVEGLRVFAGHAGWGPGQLEAEVARGDWHLALADAATLFEKKPETLWRELERRAAEITVLRSTGSAHPVRTLFHP
jgi:putative transcriptional regulator